MATLLLSVALGTLAFTPSLRAHPLAPSALRLEEGAGSAVTLTWRTPLRRPRSSLSCGLG